MGRSEQSLAWLPGHVLAVQRPKVTIEHYIRRNEHVNPLTAELLDVAFSATEADDLGGELDE